MRRHWIALTTIPLLLIANVSSAQMDRIDRERLRTMLRTTAAEIAKNFYDSSLKGLDWEQLTSEAGRKIEGARSPSEALTIISMLVDKLDDSHTKFIPPSRVNSPLFGFEAKMFGEEARIYSIKPGGAADKAGLQMGDRILQIFNYRPERKTFDQAMLYYRYLHPMSELKIAYQRGSAPPQTIDLAAKVKKSTMSLDFSRDENIYRYLVENFSDAEHYFLGVFDGDIDYVQLPSFSAEHLPVPSVSKPKAVIIDLRGNPGGRVDTLGEYAGHFEADETVLVNMISRKKTEPVKIRPHGGRFNVPMIILVDSRSASAAEMFARYFQKSGQAKVIGDITSGRVNGSRYFAEQSGGTSVFAFGVQISVARVAFEDGEELEHHPVLPDVSCLPTETDLRSQNDPCLKIAVAFARKAAGRSEELPQQVANQVEEMIAQQRDYRAGQLKRRD